MNTMYFRKKENALEELDNESHGCCLVPLKTAKEYFVTDHEKAFCGCDIQFLLDRVKTQAEIIKLYKKMAYYKYQSPVWNATTKEIKELEKELEE